MTWDEALRDLRVQRLTFRLSPEASMVLPEWPGSMVRGAIGSALERLSGEDPALASALPLIFPGSQETEQASSTPSMLVEWEPRTPGWKDAGEEWGFDVLLVGNARSVAMPVMAAVADAAQFGLGKNRVRHALVSVALTPSSGDGTPCARLLESLPASQRLVLRFVTPTCLSRTNEPPTFTRLLAAADQRMRLLVQAHLGVDLEPLSPEMLAEAETVRLDARGLEWVALKSASSKGKFSTGGHVGRAVLEGSLARFLPMMAAALALHVGRFVSIGHGRVAVEAPGRRPGDGAR